MLEPDHLVFQFCCKAGCHKPGMKSLYRSSSNLSWSLLTLIYSKWSHGGLLCV